MPNWTAATADVTTAERQTAMIPVRVPGSPDTFKEVPATDFLQKDTAGEIGNTGILRGGSSDATTGGVWGAMRYLPNQMPQVFGGMYSSAKILIGFGVRSSTTAADTFVSSIDNASWARGALVVGNDLKFYSAGAQATAVGSVVSMSLQFTIDASGNAGFGTATPGYRIHAYGGPSTSILSESNTNYGGQFRAKNTVREYSFGLTGAFTGDWTIYDVTNSHLVHSYLNTAGHTFYTNGGGRWNISTVGHFLPTADNAVNIGSAVARVGTYYGVTGTINTSDERAKRDIGAIPDEWLDAWGGVQWVRFKFTDGTRWHAGLIAQQVHAAFAANGLDAFEIGLCCYDEWEEQREPVRDDDGEIIGTRVAQAAGDRWGLRYDECQAMEAAWQRREIDRLRTALAELAAR